MAGRNSQSRSNTGRGGRSGRGTASKGRFRQVPSRTSTKQIQDKDLTFRIGGSDQAEKFIRLKKYLINQAKLYREHGIDIVKMMETGIELDLESVRPTLRITEAITDTDDEDERARKSTESREADFIYKSEYELWLKRKRSYETNKGRLCTQIMNKCDKRVTDELERMTDYAQWTMDNPLKLMRNISEICLNYQKNEYSMERVVSSVAEVFSIRQAEHESVADYVRRMKTKFTIMMTHIDIELTTYMKAASVTDEDAAREAMIAYIIIRNADKKRFGTLISDMASQQSRGTEQYPTLIETAQRILEKNEQQVHKVRKTDKQNKNKSEANKDTEQVGMSLLNKNKRTCFCCGKDDHMSSKCPEKDTRPQADWYINKAINNLNAQPNSAGQTAAPSTNESVASVTEQQGSILWNGLQLSSIPSEGMRKSVTMMNTSNGLYNKILLDTGSVPNIFSNPEMLTDIKKSKNPMTVGTNGGELLVNQEGTVPGYGQVYYNKNAIANVMSFADLEDRYHVEYTKGKFRITTDQGPIEFRREGKLYVFAPQYPFKLKKANMSMSQNLINSVEENERLFTTRQVERAKTARRLAHALGFPNTEDLRKAIKYNLIKDCPVTIEDIKVAETIYGKDIATLKGKTTRRTSKPVVNDYIEVPVGLKNLHRNVELCTDIMCVNQIPFLVTISKRMQYRTAWVMRSQKASDFRSSIDQVFRIYNAAGFQITTLHCDRQFKPIMDEIKDDLDITMNYYSAQEHVPEIERSNRIVKERVRALYHSMPYRYIPSIMVKYAVIEMTARLNYFPAKNGISKFHSPNTILHGKPLDYNKHCRYAFGAYVQAHDDDITNKNSMQPRTLDCIYLRPVTNQQGGHELLTLDKWSIITR